MTSKKMTSLIFKTTDAYHLLQRKEEEKFDARCELIINDSYDTRIQFACEGPFLIYDAPSSVNEEIRASWAKKNKEAMRAYRNMYMLFIDGDFHGYCKDLGEATEQFKNHIGE